MLRVFAYMCLPALKKALDAVAEEVGDVKVVCDEVFQPAAQRLERVQCDEYVIYVYGLKVRKLGSASTSNDFSSFALIQKMFGTSTIGAPVVGVFGTSTIGAVGGYAAPIATTGYAAPVATAGYTTGAVGPVITGTPVTTGTAVTNQTVVQNVIQEVTKQVAVPQIQNIERVVEVPQIQNVERA